MRKINVLTFLTMDGVMQGPGGPEEDTSNGFNHGGWSVGYFDDSSARRWPGRWATSSTSCSAGGRTTFSRPTGRSRRIRARRPSTTPPSTWRRTGRWRRSGSTVRLEGDVADAIRRLKAEPGPELQVHGSGDADPDAAEERPGRRAVAEDLPGHRRRRAPAVRRGDGLRRLRAGREQRVAERRDPREVPARRRREVGFVRIEGRRPLTGGAESG